MLPITEEAPEQDSHVAPDERAAAATAA